MVLFGMIKLGKLLTNHPFYWQTVCWNRPSCIVDINWRSYISWRLRQSPGDPVMTRVLGFVDSTLRQSRKSQSFGLNSQIQLAEEFKQYPAFLNGP